MIVSQTDSNGNERIIHNSDIKFPRGPLSQSTDDVIEFLEWAVEENKAAIRSMKPGDKNIQAIKVEIDNQMKALNKLKGDRNAELAKKLDIPLR